MKLPTNIPCPTRHATFANDDVRDAIGNALSPVENSMPGDLLGIAQSWWRSEDDIHTTPNLAYWVRDADGRVSPRPFRSLESDMQRHISVAVALMLENTLARDEIKPQIKDMQKNASTPSGWVDALHVKDGILLLSEYLSAENVTDAARRGKLPSLIQFLAYPVSSQHERVCATSRMTRLLHDFCVRMNGSELSDQDHRLVPMAG